MYAFVIFFFLFQDFSLRLRSLESKEAKNFEEMNARMSKLMSKVRGKSSSDECLQSKSSLDNKVKNKPPINLKNLKRMSKRSAYEGANSDDEKSKVKKESIDDDDERDSGYGISEIKGGLAISDTDLNERFKTTSAPDLSISEVNLISGRTCSRSSLASTNRQFSSEFEESAWGSQELHSEDRNYFQKDKSIGSYEDLDIDLYALDDKKRDENQNIIKSNEKEKDNENELKHKQNQLEVRRTGDSEVGGIVSKPMNGKEQCDHFNNNNDDNSQNLKYLGSLMDHDKEVKDQNSFKDNEKSSLSSSPSHAARWSDSLDQLNHQSKKVKNEKRSASDPVFGHSYSGLRFSQREYHTPSVASLKAQYEKKVSKWSKQESQDMPFGKMISKRLQELDSGENLSERSPNQPNLEKVEVKQMISRGMQVSIPMNDAMINTEIDSPLMDNILSKIMIKRYNVSVQTDQDEKLNVAKRDIAVGTEKFSRERFSTLPETKSRSTQTDLCQTRSKSIGISTDDTALENLAIKRQRYRWTRESSLYKPAKQVQTDSVMKKDVAVDIQSFSDSDHLENSSDESDTVQIVPLKGSPITSDTSTDSDVTKESKKMITQPVSQADQKVAEENFVGNVEEKGIAKSMMNQDDHRLMIYSSSEKSDQKEEISRKLKIEKALMNAIIKQPEDDLVGEEDDKDEKREKQSYNEHEKMYPMEEPKADPTDLIAVDEGVDNKNLVSESMLKNMRKDIKTRSTVIVSIQQPDKREISEINSFTTLDQEGKLSRKTQVTTTKKVPVIEKYIPLEDGHRQPTIVSLDSNKPPPSPRAEMNKAKAKPVHASISGKRDKSMRPASAIELSYVTGSSPRPVSSMAPAFSENEIDLMNEPRYVLNNQPESTSVSSFERRSRSAKSFYSSPVDYVVANMVQHSPKRQEVKQNQVIWAETSSSTIVNEMASDSFKDKNGQIHKPKSVSLTSETVIHNKGKDRQMETKTRAARKYADESIQEPDITSQTVLADSPPPLRKKMLLSSQNLAKHAEPQERHSERSSPSHYLDRHLEEDRKSKSPMAYLTRSTPSLLSNSTYSKRGASINSERSTRNESRVSLRSSPERVEYSLSHESPVDSRFKNNEMRKYISTPALESTSSLQHDEAAMITGAKNENNYACNHMNEDDDSKGTEIVTRIIKTIHPAEYDKDVKGKVRKKKSSKSKVTLEQELQSGDGVRGKDGCKISSSIIFESPLKSRSFSTSNLSNKDVIIKELDDVDDEVEKDTPEDAPMNRLRSSPSYDSLVKPRSSRHIYTQPNGEMITTTKFERYQPMSPGKERAREETVWEYSMECNCINGLNTSVR